MNSFELNKVLGAILGTCLVLLALNIGANALFSTPKLAKPGYIIAVSTGGAEKKAEVKKEGLFANIDEVIAEFFFEVVCPWEYI